MQRQFLGSEPFFFYRLVGFIRNQTPMFLKWAFSWTKKKEWMKYENAKVLVFNSYFETHFYCLIYNNIFYIELYFLFKSIIKVLSEGAALFIKLKKLSRLRQVQYFSFFLLFGSPLELLIWVLSYIPGISTAEK